MKLINIPSSEFNTRTQHLPCLNWHQTANWAELKANTGWHAHYLAYEDEDQIVAAVMILSKNIPFSKKQLFYAPRGFLIDFNNDELLRNFHKEVINYIKNNHGFELMIDPYLEYQHRDIDGNIVDDGFNNQSVVNTLLDLGYHHNNGFNLYNENLQPRWIYELDLSAKPYNQLLKDFRPEVRRRAKKKDFYSITVREIGRDEIHLYKEVMGHTANRRGFIDRPLSYYEHMYDCLNKDGMLRYFIAEIDFAKSLANLSEEVNKSEAKLAELEAKENKFTKILNEIKEENIRLASLKKNLAIIEEYSTKAKNNTVLSGVTLLTYGNEAVQLLAGNYEDFELFASSTILVSELIKIIKEEGYSIYNFYGITGDFDEKNQLNGLHVFKKGFGGHVVELIGEFEYVIDKPTKLIYELGLKVYSLLKKIRH